MNNFNQLLSDSQKKKAVETFLKIKSELLDFKRKILNEELALVEIIHKHNIQTFKALETHSANLDKIISQILTWNQIEQLQLNEQLRIILKLPSIDLSQFKSLFLPKLNKNIIFLSNWVLNDMRNLSIPKKLSWTQYNLKEELNKFRSYSLNFLIARNRIATFDAKRVKITDSKFLSSQEIDYKAAKCLLPDGNLFFHSEDKCMILYPFNYLRSMPAYKSGFWKACAIYIDGFVYLFEGLHSSSAKLNINDERWKSLSDIPFHLGKYSTCAQFKNYILLCSWRSTNIFYYDISIDSYSDIPLTGLKKVPKLIFAKNDKAFLIEFSRFIYESDESLMSWNKVEKCTEWILLIPFTSHSIEYKGKFYFANQHGVYSFNLKEKSIEFQKITSLIHFYNKKELNIKNYNN